MKRLLTGILLLFIAISSSHAARAENSSSQIISATLRPYVSVSNAISSTSSVNINSNGTLSSDLTPTFKFVSNNKNGASATFNVKVSTSDSKEVDAIAGTSNSNTGKIVLTNINMMPESSSVKNALNSNKVSSRNPNSIAYSITFKSENTDNGFPPVFDKSGNTVSGNVLTKNGANTIMVIVNKNSVKAGTFSPEDKPGIYQATIYCTSAVL